MIVKYLVFFILIRLSFENEWVCPKEPQQPQLSPTFISGYWYEKLSMNNYLNDDPCSHFHIFCNDESSCEIVHARWDSYMLMELYNGTIVQEDNQVKLKISENSTSITKEAVINIKLDNKVVLIWNCNSSSLTDSFASLLIRMETEEDMEAIWEESNHENGFPGIINDFPAGIWSKNNLTHCTNGATVSNTYINSFLIASLLVIPNFI